MLAGIGNGFRNELPAAALAFMDLAHFGMIDDHFVIACHAIDHQSGRRSGIANIKAAPFFVMIMLYFHSILSFGKMVLRKYGQQKPNHASGDEI